MASGYTYDAASSFWGRVRKAGLYEEAQARLKELKGLPGEDGYSAWERLKEEYKDVGKKPEKVVEAAVVVEGEHEPDPEEWGNDVGLKDMASILPRDVQWIYDNLGAKKLSKADSPSPGAWAWRETIILDATARNQFFRDIVPKFLPPPKFVEAANRMNDTGATSLELIDRIMVAIGE